jgi:hypothetical protein
MTRLFLPSVALRAFLGLALVACLVASVLPRTTQAADTKQLQRVRGTVGYATLANAGDFKTVFAKFDLPDDDFAVTRGASAAVLAMPDSSLIALGENTSVQVGAFDAATAGPGSTIKINGGSLRFDIKRPTGGVANYHFETATSQVAVRGTIGLLAFTNGVTTVGCVVCAADSVTVTAGGQTLALATGQFITVSALGVMTTGALSTVVTAFGAAGVPTTAQAGAAAAGVPGAGAAAAAVVPAVAGAAVAGAAVGIAASNQHTPQPTATPTNAPTPVGTPSGTANLTSHAQPAAHAPAQRAPAAAPFAAPSPPAVAPAAGRFGR